MQVPSHSWAVEGDLFHHLVRERVTKLPPLKEPFRDLDFIQSLLRDPRTHDLTPEEMSVAFHHVVDKRINPTLTAIAQDPSVVSMVHRSQAKQALAKGEIDFNTISVDEILEAHKATGVNKRPLNPTGVKTVEPLHPNLAAPKEQKIFKNLMGEQRLYGGMSLLIAGMSAVGAFGSFRNAVTKDGEGRTQVHWSNVAIGLVSTALAVGTAYAAHQQLTHRPTSLIGA